MAKRITMLAFLVLFGSMIGCGGKSGTEVTGVIVEDGTPLKLAPSDQVSLYLLPEGEKMPGGKANPGAFVNPADATFKFVGDVGVPPGKYKVVLSVVPDEKTNDRFDGRFGPKDSPLTYTIAENTPKENLVIDVKKNTVTRK